MNRPELISECSRRFGKRAWLGASNSELAACLATGEVPQVWLSGRPSASGSAMAGSAVSAAPESATNLVAASETIATRSDGLADAIAQALQGRITAGIDEAAVQAICARMMHASNLPRSIEIKLPDRAALN